MDRFLVMLFFGAIAIALWGFGGRWAWQSWDLTEHGVVVSGKVTALIATTSTRREGDRENRLDVVETSHKPIVEFVAAGQTRELVPIVNIQPYVPGVGSVVPVRYRSEHPDEATLDTFAELWLVPIVLGVVGLLAFLAALVAASPPSAHSPYARYVPFAAANAKPPRAPASKSESPSAAARPKPRRGKRAVFHVPGDESPPN